MDEFRLEEWEVPVGVEAPPEGVFVTTGPLDWQGAPTMFAMKVAPFDAKHNIAFYRPQDGATNFVLLERAGDGGWQLSLHSKRVAQAKISAYVSAYFHLERYALGRLFWVDGQMCLIEAGTGAWIERNRPITPFSLPCDALSEPSSRVFAWLCQQWEAPESQMHLAWEWNGGGELHKLAFYGGHAPDQNELVNLMRQACRLELLPEGDLWVINNVFVFHPEDEEDAPEHWKRLYNWSRVFVLHFLPRYHRLEDVPPFLVSDFEERFNFYLFGEEVSQHERLEARLRLREWLEHNAPDRMDLLP